MVGKDKLCIIVYCELTVDFEYAVTLWEEIEQLQRSNRHIFDKTIVENQFRFRVHYGNKNAVCMNDIRTMLARFLEWDHADPRMRLLTCSSLKGLGETTPHLGVSTRGRKRRVPTPISQPTAAAI